MYVCKYDLNFMYVCMYAWIYVSKYGCFFQLIFNSEFYYKATGIAPEYVEFPDNGDMVVGSTGKLG